MSRSLPSDWNELISLAESCAFEQSVQGRCALNMWCRVCDVSSAFRSLLSPDACFSDWLWLQAGARACSPSNTWQPLPCGRGQRLQSFKHLSVLRLPFFFVIPLLDSVILFSRLTLLFCTVWHCVRSPILASKKKPLPSRIGFFFSYLFDTRSLFSSARFV